MGDITQMKRFAVLLCAEDSEYVKKKYGGYFGVFVKMLAEEGEIWDVFRVCNGQFPSEDEIGVYDGFVITGSCNDAHGNDVWICKLLVLLNKLELMNKKVLGICFGHQDIRTGRIIGRGTEDNGLYYVDEVVQDGTVMLAHGTTEREAWLWHRRLGHPSVLARALGGKVTRATSGWDIGIRTINLSTSTKTLANLKLPTRLSIIECHRDEVRELPPKVEVLASSDKTRVEMFRYGNHIMGIQGHPEYTKDILMQLIDRLLQRSYIQEWHAINGRASMDQKEPDREVWRKLCTSFLKGRL